MKKVLTLILIRKDDNILLGQKKRGFGMGKWNGFGGKVEKGETIEEAAKRELFEEADITVGAVEKIGVLEFSWKGKEADILEVHSFTSADFSGEPAETEEMKPQWFTIDKIPLEKMWPDDRYWFPLFLAGKKFEGKFLYGENDVILEYTLSEVEKLS